MPSDPNAPVPDEAARLASVAEAIRRRADPTGFVPFDQFQAIALYLPGAGYYDAPDRRIGPAGDFYTAAHVSPLFGATLADRVAAEFVRLGSPFGFRVVEVGPGDGTLARSMIDALDARLPADANWEYLLVERSSALREQAVQRLAEAAASARVRVAEALSTDGPFRGVVIANELLDAQPARRLRYGTGRWRELGVRWNEDRFVAAESDLRPVVGMPLPEIAPDGAILEFAPSAEGFVRELADHLTQGTAIVLDYGAEEPDLLLGRPRGTLQAIRGHRTLPDPLDRPGYSDLSTFVDFTRVRSAAASAGLVERFCGPQREALRRWGFERRLESALAAVGGPEAEVRLRLAAKNLLFGFESFRVIEWSAGDTLPAT